MPEEQAKNEIASEIIYCPDCNADGWKDNGSTCSVCSGGGVLLRIRGVADYFWGEELSGNLSFLRSFGRVFKSSARFLAYLLAVLSLLYGFYFIISKNGDFFLNFKGDMKSVKLAEDDIFGSLVAAAFYFAANLIEALGVIFKERGVGPLLFWSGLMGAMYAYYFSKTADLSQKGIGLADKEFKPFYEDNPARLEKAVDVSVFASSSTLVILKKALDLSHDRAQAPGAFHLARVLLEDEDIGKFMARLEIDTKVFGEYLDELIKTLPQNDRYHKSAGTVMSPELKKIAIIALQESLIAGFDMIEPESLFLALFSDSDLEKYFHDLKIDLKDIRSAVLWAKDLSKMRARIRRPRKISHTIMNKAWTARTTPELDQFSYDMTDYARSGLTGSVVNRQKEIDALNELGLPIVP